MNQGAGSFSVLANRSFRSLTLAGMLWLLGDNIEHVISYWVLFEKFDSPLLAGYAVISHWAPFLLGGVLAGSLADRFDCRKLFLISMVMFMGVSFGWAFVFWTDTLAVWHAVLFLAVHGIAGVLFTPASQMIIHDIVRPEDVPSAVRMTATSRQLGLLLGPGVGALLLFALSPEAGLAINAFLYLPMVAWSLREPYTGHWDISDAERRGRRISWSLGAVFDSIRLARLNPTIFGMIAMGGLTSFIVGNAHQAQLPEFAEGFNQDDSGLAYTLLLLAGATGAIVGGLLLELLPRAHPTPRRAIRLAALWTVCMLVFAAAPAYGVGLVTLFLSGVFLIGFTSMAQALVQLEAPVETRGRMIGLFNTSLNGLRVGSGVTVGFVGAVIGIHWSLGISAVVLLIALAALALWIRRHAREALAPQEVAPALVEDSIG
ncbi:MAG TPA: MFS transporter [Dehalococcoidia bacterium]|nr:MFS transporter [Dehalococcoidia bacterium]